MGYQFWIFPQQRISLFRFEGQVSVAIARKAFESYVQHPDFDPSYPMITDARGVLEVDASFRQIVRNILGLSRPLCRFDRPVPSVVLVGNDTVFGMVRMLEQVLDSVSRIELRAVWSEAEALSLARRTEVRLEEVFGPAIPDTTAVEAR